MKEFDLEKALAGEPVQTRNGQEVPQPHLFDVDGVEYPLVSVIGGEVTCWTEDGYFLHDQTESHLDLFMAPKKRIVHFNFYEIGRGGFGSDMRGYGYYMPEDAEMEGAGGERIGGRSYPVVIEE